MIIALIVAMDDHRGIGFRQSIPWHLPSDLKRFKTLTMGHHLIVGRKTFETIGKPLPGRTMIIVTRQELILPNGCYLSPSVSSAIALAKQSGDCEVFIAGGGEIYSQAIQMGNRMYVSRVHTTVETDTFFPDWNPHEWRVVYREESNLPGELPYTYQVLDRIKHSAIDKLD
jgi:dihydrofolate reductase